MAPSIYTPLPSNTSHLNIRLIKLQPSDDPTVPICCKLVCYPLVPERSHLYECLSYVWGSPENPETVRIDTAEGYVDFDVTQNLYAALLELRDPIFERVLWIDAICINQKDEEEKAQQVLSMTRIFGLASRVVVWLGEEADQSGRTFEQLRKLAQQRQPVIGHPQDDHPDLSANDSRVSCNTDACDAFALLSRTYFRRMWVLQEVTAARSVLFKCGPAELQGATFLAGLDGLPPMNDWRLRNRIRAFILLIQRSAFRESLKGQDQLHIDPLMDLIDRFHTHEATDIRDKIFALWGLSAESKLTSILRPDYSKSWGSLLTNLGLYVFGKDSKISASELKQIVYARSPCHYLGKVMIVHDAGMWDTEQRLEISSMRLFKFLVTGNDLTLTIKMRSSAEEIQEQDIVCFLPRTKMLIFARAESHFLRIISIIESRSVQVSTDKCSKAVQHWTSWQPILNFTEGEMIEVPFLWSWERCLANEDQEVWCLMRKHASNTIRQAHEDACDISEAIFLSEMATLHMQMNNYEAACLNLNAIIECYSSEHGLEDGMIEYSRMRLDSATRNRSMYVKAKKFLVSREHDRDDAQSPGVFELCFHIVVHAGMHVLVETLSLADAKAYIESRSIMQLTATHIWIEFAAVIISRGIRKHLILDTIKMCDLDWEGLRDRLSSPYGYGYPEDSFDRKDIELLPRTNRPHNDYLGFLLLMSDHNLGLSGMELGTAFKANIDARNLNSLLKHCGTPVFDLCILIDVLWERQDRLERLISALEGNADRVWIASEAIVSTSRWDSRATQALLKAAKDGQSITPLLLETLLVDHKLLKPYILRDFADAIETEWSIGEDALMTLFGAEYPSYRRQDDLISFLENKKITMNITEPVLEELLRNDDKTYLYLMFRQDPSIMNDRYIVDKYGRSHESTKRMLAKLALLQEGARPIKPGHDALASSDSQCRYAQLLNLMRHRRKEFEITTDLFMRMAYPTQARQSSQESDVIERIGCCMVRHAEETEIAALIESSDVLNLIALGGYVSIIEDLQRRVHNISPEFELFRQVANWSLSIKDADHNRHYHGSKAHRELLESLGTMSIPPQLQQTLLKLACTNLEYTRGYDVLGKILSHKVIDVPLPLEFQRTLLCRVLNQYQSPMALKTLLKCRVIGANTAFGDQSTVLHLVVSYHGSYQMIENMVNNVVVVMQYGGAASINVKNGDGKTPSQVVKKMYKRELKEGGSSKKCDLYSNILSLFS